MARVIALAAARVPCIHGCEVLRRFLVCGCAIALILAGRALPFS